MTRCASARRGWHGACRRNVNTFRNRIPHPTMTLPRQLAKVCFLSHSTSNHDVLLAQCGSVELAAEIGFDGTRYFGPSRLVPQLPGWRADIFRDGVPHPTMALPHQLANVRFISSMRQRRVGGGTGSDCTVFFSRHDWHGAYRLDGIFAFHCVSLSSMTLPRHSAAGHVPSIVKMVKMSNSRHADKMKYSPGQHRCEGNQFDHRQHPA